MKKVIPILLLFLSFSVPTLLAYYWDYPVYMAKNTVSGVYWDVKTVKVRDKVLIFTLFQERDNARIEFFTTENLNDFNGPFIAVEKIEINEGFFPHYDVLDFNNTLFLVWNTLSGNIMVSESNDGGENWHNERALMIGEAFSFDPHLFALKDELYLFYHTESEGRRIDFFFLKSRDSGKTFTEPYRIVMGFAGSFFPYIGSFRGDIYTVWQSRPFSKAEIPAFDIYLSISRDSGYSWTPPLNLTEDLLGESVRPFISFTDDRFVLLWEGDRDGAWGIYYREYDLEGNPLTEDVKINRSIVNAKEAKVLLAEGNPFVFYIDGRDGHDRLYYSFEVDGVVEEAGPLGTRENDILHYEPVQERDKLYIFLEDSGGIAFIGPDKHVPEVEIRPVKSSYIGAKGIGVSWKEPEDSSGIDGYCYDFSRNEFYEPEIINLASRIRSLNLYAGQEDNYYFHLRAKDKAGNYSKTVTIPFTVDISPPSSPSIIPPKLNKDGFFEDNSPLFEWTKEDADIAGYNYVLARKKVKLGTPRLLTSKSEVKYSSIEGGTWYFSVASVDRAGNVSETSHFKIRLKPLSQPVKKEKQIKLAPPWILSRKTFEVNPFLNISLYLVLGGLLFITVVISLDIIFRYLSMKEGMVMEKKEDVSIIRKKRLGLRFKFSILIGVLVLFLTIGISSILSIVSIEQEKRALADQMMDKAKLSLENMTNVAREGILNNDELLLFSVIAKTMENKDIKHSIILDVNNRVIAHSDLNERDKVYSDDFTREAREAESILISPDFSAEELVKLYELASPIIFAEKRIGTVRIGYSADSIFNTIDEVRKTSIYNTIVITVVTIIIGILGAIMMATITIKPIKILAKGVNIIGGGRLDYKIHIKGRDEIGLLADEFNRMTERLLEYQKQMENKAKLDEQLEIARGIQQDLIPSVGIDNDTMSIDGFYKAAAGIGGDYYDFIEIGHGKYGLIMSDVAGKGVPASLMMIMIRTVFKSLIHSGVSEPSRVVTLMNNTLASDIASDRFATLLFAVFSINNMVFRYTNAGYGPLMVYKKEQKQCFLVNPPEGSAPIGFMSEVEYMEESPIKLGSGDAVFLFTDGIHEARNKTEKEYGMKRLSDIIPSFADKGSKEMANLIIDDVLNFVGEAEQYDDMTLMIIKVK